jgi:hypothetical protein
MDFSLQEFQLQVSGKPFISSLLNLLKNAKDSKLLQIKVLELIQKWGLKFESQKDIMPNFYETYKVLKDKGCEFPKENKYINTYKQYINIKEPLKNDNALSQEQNLIKLHQQSKKKINNYGKHYLNLNPKIYPTKLQQIVGELPGLLEYVLLDNELIDNCYKEMKGNPHTKIDISIVDLTQTIQDLAVQLRKMVEKRIDDEKLTAICLGILEDLNLLNDRYEDLKNRNPVREFKSSFAGEYAIYDLNNPNNIYVQEEEEESEDDEDGESDDDDDDED